MYVTKVLKQNKKLIILIIPEISNFLKKCLNFGKMTF